VGHLLDPEQEKSKTTPRSEGGEGIGQKKATSIILGKTGEDNRFGRGGERGSGWTDRSTPIDMEDEENEIDLEAKTTENPFGSS
jgi:hypothetical protein